MDIAVHAGYAKVQQLVRMRRYKEALAEAENLLRQTPEEPNTYALIGWIHSLTDNHDKALHFSGEALARDPENRLAWHVRVTVFYETDREREFEEALAEALRVDPYEDHYYFLKAARLNKKGKFKDAKEQLMRALELNPESAHNLALLAYTEALLDNDEESRKAEREALQRETEDAIVYMHLAWAASRRGEYDPAERYMANAVRLNPENKQVRDEYLEALQKSNKFYRIFLWPAKILRKLKPWQILVSWIVAWILFKPLIILFIVLYVLAHWISMGIVRVRVFGWRMR